MDRAKNPTERWTAGEILQTLEKNRHRLRSLRVRKIGLFGSYGRGEASGDSDLDFLVSFDQPTFDSYMDLKFFLEDLFGCKIDIVLEDTLKPRLRPRIMNEVQYAKGL